MIDDLHAHVVSLKRYAYVLCRNGSDAEDLVQETLLKAISAADTFRPGGELRPWLFSILHNTYLSHRRQFAKRARAATFLESSLSDSTPPAQEEHVQAHNTIKMLSRLSPDQQAAMILIAVEGLSYEEAADVLGIPVGTLMSRLARGREQLRRLVGEERSKRLRAVR